MTKTNEYEKRRPSFSVSYYCPAFLFSRVFNFYLFNVFSALILKAEEVKKVKGKGEK